MNILFTSAGRRNYLINYFKEALQGQGKVFAADMQTTAPALVDADVAIQIPCFYCEDYITAIINIVKTHNIHAIISLNDLELPILSKNKEVFEQLGTKLLVSNENVIKTTFDKWETAKFLEKIGLKTPKTFLCLKHVKASVFDGSLKFPLVVKPRWGSASIGLDFVESLEELELAYRLQSIRLGKTILAQASKEDINHAILIQEKIDGVEYGMDVLNDFEGNYVGSFVRKKLSMRAGETDKAVSVIDERFNEVGKIIGENLKHIGNLDCDVFEHNGELYILELNPRFGGGYPFSHEAGNDTASIYIEWIKGNKNISQFSNYKAGMTFSKCDRLLNVNN